MAPAPAVDLLHLIGPAARSHRNPNPLKGTFKLVELRASQLNVVSIDTDKLLAEGRVESGSCWLRGGSSPD